MPFNNDVLSIVYGLIGAYTLYNVYVNRASFFDEFVTSEDIRLTVMIGIFVLTPFGVLLHEAGHYLTAKYFGAVEIELHHRGYWGFVSYVRGPEFDSSNALLVTLAGPMASVMLAFGCIFTAAVVPTRTIVKRTLAFFGLIDGFHILVGYPLIDAFSGLEGDFHTLYSSLPMAAVVVAAIIHISLLGLLLMVWKMRSTRPLFEGI